MADNIENLKDKNKEDIILAVKQLNRRVVGFPPVHIDITGSVTAGYLLSQIWYWSEVSSFKEFYKTDKDFCDELRLSIYELKGAKERLKELGIVKIYRKGIPAKTYYKLNLGLYVEKITSYGKTKQLEESASIKEYPVVENVDNKLWENSTTIYRTEITTEINNSPPLTPPLLKNGKIRDEDDLKNYDELEYQNFLKEPDVKNNNNSDNQPKIMNQRVNILEKTQKIPIEKINKNLNQQVNLADQAIEIWNKKIMDGQKPIAPNSWQKQKFLSSFSNVFKNDLQEWSNCCERIQRNDFLMGRTQSSWKITFDWITNESHMKNVLQGKYFSKINNQQNQFNESTKKNVIQSDKFKIRFGIDKDVCDFIKRKFGDETFVSWIENPGITFSQGAEINEIILNAKSRFYADFALQKMEREMSKQGWTVRKIITNQA